MNFLCTILFISLSAVSSAESAEQYRVAVAHLVSENVTGSVWFMETDQGLQVTGFVQGKEPGRYGFHIHELGDTSDCDATGSHFNPDGTTHGGRNHTVRHVGDLGNLYVENAAIANFSFVDSTITLRGRNNILGRGLVLHEQEDDLGLGGNAASLTTGNAGSRVACAVIGMHAPVDAWYYSSSSNIVPSIILLTIVSMLSTSIFKF